MTFAKRIVSLLGVGAAFLFVATASHVTEAEPPFVAAVPYHVAHPKEWFAAEQCVDCHAANGAKSPLLNRKQCETCHNLEMYPDHQPQYARNPKACLWCHSRTPNIQITAHMVKAHQNCASCHDLEHRGTKPVRAQCITCHQNRKKHTVDAPVCYGCHIFSEYSTVLDPVGNGAPIGTPVETPVEGLPH